MSPEVPNSDASSASKSTWLHTFHLVLILDLSDPSSAAAGNSINFRGDGVRCSYSALGAVYL